MKLSYIIGYRHQEDRFGNLKTTLKWLSTLEIDGVDIQVIIVEQDVIPKMPKISGVTHIFIYNPWPYNRSWSFNVAAKEHVSDVYAFGDSDLIMDNSDFILSINEISNFDVLSPYKSVLDLDKNESSKDLDYWKKINRPGRGESDHQKINLCGGLVFFTKDGFEKVGGWNEDFVGWGGEDDFMTLKVEKMGLKTKEMPYKIYHLFHHREPPDISFYRQNLIILNQLIGIDKKTIELYAKNIFPMIGNRNKYLNK